MFYIEQDKLIVKIPVKNKGKFRWKNRKSINDFGIGFSTDKTAYSHDSYVEWQIGYDIPVHDYNKNPEAKPFLISHLLI